MPTTATSLLELQVLRGVARALGSDPDPRVVLTRVAEAVACGRPDRDVYLYTYDPTDNDLVLVGATESPAATHVGSLRVAYGSGVTGWVAASRESYLVADEPARDPRFLAYPGIGEERYGAIFSVPIVSAGDELVGCITVWATTGNRFADFEVGLVEDVAAMVAASFERERLAGAAQRSARDLDGVHALAAMVTGRVPVATVVDRATELARSATDADVAVAVVTDPSGADRMVLKTGPASDPGVAATLASLRPALLEIDLELRRSRISWQVASDRVARALEGSARAVTTAAVRVGADELGSMACYRLDPRGFGAPGPDVVRTIAHQVATAIKLTIALDGLEERNALSWFLRDLTSGRLGSDELVRRATAVGLDRARSHVIAVASLTGLPAVASLTPAGMSPAPLEGGLSDHLARTAGLPRDTLFASTPHQVVAVVPWTSGRSSLEALRLALVEACATLRSSTGAALTVGLSRPVSSLEELGDGLAEAREAMIVGSTMANPSGVFTLDDVGHHLLLSRVSSAATVPDRYAVAVARIAEYDRVKRTELLDTLAAFLHVRSQSAAARELIIHRNTLNQRLTRASRLGGLDVHDPAEWFPLQLALKVHQARTGTWPGELAGPPAERAT
ncbi:GAF domain-containing protein [Nocardioides oleivorans]|uniref:GAF domain-containing protein n=1 Tax=Nocardioides oleivorans TaxID=273676 RepID=A0A4Q2RYC5_9ACTN|nr:helix-turn-helix domain-containing protein [Nocardioides oleivorans]RYB94088.1 GAF domain-containing protein [Nocardioides oleivorans]